MTSRVILTPTFFTLFSCKTLILAPTGPVYTEMEETGRYWIFPFSTATCSGFMCYYLFLLWFEESQSSTHQPYKFSIEVLRLIIYTRLKALPDAAHHVMVFCITGKCSVVKHWTYCVFSCAFLDNYFFLVCVGKRRVCECVWEAGGAAATGISRNETCYSRFP